MKNKLRIPGVLVALALALAACGGGTAATTATTAATVTTMTETTDDRDDDGNVGRSHG